MLKISKLENEKEILSNKINLFDITEEVISELELLKISKKNEIIVEGSANIFWKKEHFIELILRGFIA